MKCQNSVAYECCKPLILCRFLFLVLTKAKIERMGGGDMGTMLPRFRDAWGSRTILELFEWSDQAQNSLNS